uniref:Docking protein 1 n=1 Tax=Pavo cristatus TaxID=9049 RepID=A0A8C9EIC0_PAVCR
MHTLIPRLVPIYSTEGAVPVGSAFQVSTKSSSRWKRGWFALFPASQHGVARLEFFDCKEAAGPAGRLGTRRLDKTVVRLADCTSVTPAPSESGPRAGTAAFRLETSGRSYLLAAEQQQQSEEWVAKLCEIAFPVKGSGEAPVLEMAVNSIYYSRDEVNAFWVTVQRTEASERCELRGSYVLKAERDSLILKDPRTSEILYVWPYRLLRRYGRDKVMFSFEAGRRCDSGPGNFTFETKQGNEIFRLVEASIREQKAQVEENQQSCDSLESDSPKERDPPVLQAKPPITSTPPRSPLPKAPRAVLPDKDPSSLYSEPLDSVKGFRPRLDPLYADPVDSKAAGAADGVKLRVPFPGPCEQVRAEGCGPVRKEHIYDEPEGCAPRVLPAAASIYDEARPIGEAWRTQGHDGKSGYEYPYNPSTDDYSVPAFKAKGPKPVPAPKPPATFISKCGERSEDPGRRRGNLAPEKATIKPGLNSSNNNNNTEVLYRRVMKAQLGQRKEQCVDECSLSPVYEDLGEI